MKKILFIMFQGLGTNQKRWIQLRNATRFIDYIKTLSNILGNALFKLNLDTNHHLTEYSVQT